MQQKEWAQGRIHSKGGARAVGAWIIAGSSNGLIWTVMILFWNDPGEKDGVKVLSLFCLVGLGITDRGWDIEVDCKTGDSVELGVALRDRVEAERLVEEMRRTIRSGVKSLP